MSKRRFTALEKRYKAEDKSYDVPVQPLFENLVTVREEEEKYAGTIIIPDTNKEKPMGALVVAVGPDVKHISPGDFILVGRYAGADCTFREVKYTIIRESEVLGIVPEGGK